jgi:homoserine dehydrogenase
VVHDFNVILNDPEVSIVAEMLGGSHPAYDFTKACLLAGKSVVTSNKEVVANFGVELLELAAQNGASYLFEASVGGGIPIIRPINNDLSSNQIISVSGILNGTTNYILTKMESEGADFESVLKDAQRKGYAEANPAADVEGLDAARKIVILAAMSYGKRVMPTDIHCEGITSITLDDIKIAREMGYAVKLIGHTELLDGKVLAMVSPRLVPMSNPISGVNDVFNGILVNANMVGNVMFYGPGAGKLPTASAVVADIIDIMAHTPAGIKAPVWTDAIADDIADFDSYSCANLFVLDAPVSDLDEVINNLDAGAVYPCNGRTALISRPMTEKDVRAFIASVDVPVVTRIRVL